MELELPLPCPRTLHYQPQDQNRYQLVFLSLGHVGDDEYQVSRVLHLKGISPSGVEVGRPG